jgi:hypothetical protein
LKQGQQQALIDAPPQACFDAITEGAGLRPCGAAFRLRCGASRLRGSDLGTSHRSEARRSEARQPPEMWDYLGGDVRDIDGPIRKVLSDQVMKRSVDDLKRRVESLTR